MLDRSDDLVDLDDWMMGMLSFLTSDF